LQSARLAVTQSCSLSITLSVIGLAIYFLKYYQLCNLMTPDDTLCRLCWGYYFLFLLSTQKATSKWEQRKLVCFAERKWVRETIECL